MSFRSTLILLNIVAVVLILAFLAWRILSVRRNPGTKVPENLGDGHSDDELDVWLINWKPGLSTELHDHGGSLGALTVISGELREHRWNGHRMRSRRLAAGDQAAFPLGWVHDVAGDALSVHAYSPPLTAMSYYAVTADQRLRRTRTELTDASAGG